MEPPAELQGAPPRRGAAVWAVLGAGLAVGLANVAKPVHIDDTLVPCSRNSFIIRSVNALTPIRC